MSADRSKCNVRLTKYCLVRSLPTILSKQKWVNHYYESKKVWKLQSTVVNMGCPFKPGKDSQSFLSGTFQKETHFCAVQKKSMTNTGDTGLYPGNTVHMLQEPGNLELMLLPLRFIPLFHPPLTFTPSLPQALHPILSPPQDIPSPSFPPSLPFFPFPSSSSPLNSLTLPLSLTVINCLLGWVIHLVVSLTWTHTQTPSPSSPGPPFSSSFPPSIHSCLQCLSIPRLVRINRVELKVKICLTTPIYTCVNPHQETGEQRVHRNRVTFAQENF